MNEQQITARLAGLSYFLSSATGAYHYGGMQQFEAGGARSLAHIEAWKHFFALASVIGSFGIVIFLLSALAFFRLFRPVAPIAGTLLLAFVALGLPITLIALLHQMDIVALLNAAPEPGDAIEQAQIAASLRGYDNAIFLSAVFWGLWLGPLGWVMFRTGGIIPKIIGGALMIAVLPYVFALPAHFLVPNYDEIVPVIVRRTFLGVGELGAMVWFTIIGAPWRFRA